MTLPSIGMKFALPLLTFSLILGVAACGSKDQKKPASQVAAKVNAEEISVHQVNFMISRSGNGNSSPEQAPKIRRAILDKLVTQQLAVEQALENKLDQLPDVHMAIEAAHLEILERAYIAQLTGAVTQPDAAEAKKYYAEHPQLFAERRIYNIQEIQLPAMANVTGSLREMIAAGKQMEEITNWLKDKNIKFTAGNSVRMAEQIPLEILPKVHVLKDGQSVLIDGKETLTILHVVASQSSPVTEAEALPRIQQFLGNLRAADVVDREFKKLKAKAKITYQGEFASAGSDTLKPVNIPAATTAPEEKSPANISLEKGVAGLK